MIATAVMFVVCLVAARLRHAALEVLAAAAVVALFTFVSRVWSANSDMPWSAAPWPMQDLVCGVLALAMYRKDREWWKMALAVPFVLQCAAHVWYWGPVFVDGGVTVAATRAYLWVINPLFAVELGVLTIAGGGYVLSYLRDRRGVFRPAHVVHHARLAGHR